MKRLTWALAEAEREISAAKTTNKDIEATLVAALQAASHCEAAYLTAPDPIKRQINQGFFVKLFISEDGSVERAELTEPFKAMLEAGEPPQTDSTSTQGTNSALSVVPDSIRTPDTASATSRQLTPSGVLAATYEADQTVTERAQKATLRDILAEGGLNETYLVELRGIEPLTFSMRTRRATNCATAPQ
ncbi:MAG: recombinase [Amycolatopsis sp.]|nr:recombinase [Amycolatopsis sp.]